MDRGLWRQPTGFDTGDTPLDIINENISRRSSRSAAGEESYVGWLPEHIHKLCSSKQSSHCVTREL